jgi:hypothetical protein
MQTALLFLIGLALPFILLALVARSVIRASNQWKIVAEGLVAEVKLNDVPRSLTPNDAGFLQTQAAETTIIFDHGERIVLLGNYSYQCKAGDLIFVQQNKLGDYRVEKRLN